MGLRGPDRAFHDRGAVSGKYSAFCGLRHSPLPLSRGEERGSRSLRSFFVAFLLLLTTLSFAHPANVPVAKAKYSADGKLELRVHFDILAFVCEEKPTVIFDPPMNAMLDGDQDLLGERLKDAEARFIKGLSILSEGMPVSIDSITFPALKDIQDYVKENPKVRLPVMLTVVVTCHLQPSSRVSYKFPELLDTVILTREFPYQEPIAEPVEPGAKSTSVITPTKAQIDALAATFNVPREVPIPKMKPEQAKRAIQSQYDAWTTAYVNNDVDILLGILAPDYVLKTAKGDVIHFAEYKVGLDMKRGKKPDTKSYKQKILNVTLQGGVAAVWSRETTTVRDRGPEPVTFEHDYIDTWVWKSGKWLLQNTATQKEQIIKK